MSKQHSNQLSEGSAMYGRLQRQRADRYRERYNNAVVELRAERDRQRNCAAALDRVRALPRHTTVEGEWVVDATALDRALEVTR